MENEMSCETMKNERERGMIFFNNGNNVDIKECTNIEDPIQIFNMQENCDYKLNDCEGETIRVKGYYIKKIEKKLDEPIIKEINGKEIKMDKEYKIITILLDDNHKSYITASKPFAYQFLKLIGCLGDKFISNGFLIEITKRNVPNSQNKSLSFKIVT